MNIDICDCPNSVYGAIYQVILNLDEPSWPAGRYIIVYVPK